MDTYWDAFIKAYGSQLLALKISEILEVYHYYCHDEKTQAEERLHDLCNRDQKE
jgi:hypothetical protein